MVKVRPVKVIGSSPPPFKICQEQIIRVNYLVHKSNKGKKSTDNQPIIKSSSTFTSVDNALWWVAIFEFRVVGVVVLL